MWNDHARPHAQLLDDAPNKRRPCLVRHGLDDRSRAANRLGAAQGEGAGGSETSFPKHQNKKTP